LSFFFPTYLSLKLIILFLFLSFGIWLLCPSQFFMLFWCGVITSRRLINLTWVKLSFVFNVFFIHLAYIFIFEVFLNSFLLQFDIVDREIIKLTWLFLCFFLILLFNIKLLNLEFCASIRFFFFYVELSLVRT